MKSDFRKFRLYSRLAIVFMVLAMIAFACCNVFGGGCGDDVVGGLELKWSLAI